MSQRIDQQESIPVPRNRILVLEDGTFAVQWEEKRIQELLSGKYRIFHTEQVTDPISDYELKQLVEAGVVDLFDEELVYLSPLPNVVAHEPTRSYYLNTTLGKAELKAVEHVLNTAQLQDEFSVRIRQGFVVLWGANGVAFTSFDVAERAREILSAKAPELFSNLIVAFVETTVAP